MPVGNSNQFGDLFAQSGRVTEVNLMLDRVSGRSRGFAFVSMESKEAADAATQALNGKNWQGRDLSVNEARPQEERPDRPSRSGGGGYRSRRLGLLLFDPEDAGIFTI